MKWLLLQTAMISSAVESRGQKQLRMAAGYPDGTKIFKKLSEQRKMLLKPSCKTGDHLICYGSITMSEKLQLKQ